MGVLHQPRVALDGARVFVAAANAEVYWWLTDMIGRYFGEMYQLKLAETRLRLQHEDATYAEAGAWRVRLQEMLRERPELTPVLWQMVAETTERMPR
ncbi:hypothetical protein [Planobispora takensis]|uniref:hypothetical protein n=1 Tax=Planobispora takensis TaxID=1367882 RepID=UPI0019413858|nr:hypothetical protein [Planobispora takensis]